MTARRQLPPVRLLRAAVATAGTSHVHWFRWAGEEPYGNGSLYRCRCGEFRPGL
ncbi:hypothetical protein [Blastococcus tunisiensis]|uniref:Uncharacterized protein n=1 Tax=Blastococcus tunisiensis TaxID=1798228 RepID=A0A1I2JEA5_9ACTN|nr:hypothetical protein [Blastococcus sp. DSM 46838]SFF51497.1 hypothetical protein SAMN05216574_115124 [Blastococcus sp. DSM 46838]